VLSVALLEIVFTVTVSWLLGNAVNWPFYDTLFLGAALASSSTTIVAKVLGDLGKMQELPARIILGMLVLEDVFVVLFLAVLQNLAVNQSFSTEGLLILLLKRAVFVGGTLCLGILLIPRLIKRTAEKTSHEVLYVALLALSFGFAAIANFSGFSVAIGAFLIGVVVADSHISENISEEFRHLRHMFEAIFFVTMGALMDITLLGTYWLPALMVILALMEAKFTSCALGVRLFGYDRLTSLKVALGMAQIGEFAFIVGKAGQDLGVTSSFLLPEIGISAIVTSINTPYLLKYAYKT
jgi:monovalent cation:H+ antiporter-2, CPA2 family